MYNRHEHINFHNRNNCFDNNYLHHYQTPRRKRRHKDGSFRCSNWFGSIWHCPHVHKWADSRSHRRNRMVVCFKMALQHGLVKDNCSCSDTLGCRINNWGNFANRNGPILETYNKSFIHQKFFIFN